MRYNVTIQDLVLCSFPSIEEAKQYANRVDKFLVTTALNNLDIIDTFDETSVFDK